MTTEDRLAYEELREVIRRILGSQSGALKVREWKM